MQLGVIGYYELNKDYIAKNLCVNRDKPQMKCCGKCYLKKHLNKIGNDESSKNLPNKVEKNEVMVFVIPSSFSILHHSFNTKTKVFNPSLQNLYNTSVYKSIFHPPSLA